MPSRTPTIRVGDGFSIVAPLICQYETIKRHVLLFLRDATVTISAAAMEKLQELVDDDLYLPETLPLFLELSESIILHPSTRTFIPSFEQHICDNMSSLTWLAKCHIWNHFPHLWARQVCLYYVAVIHERRNYDKCLGSRMDCSGTRIALLASPRHCVSSYRLQLHLSVAPTFSPERNINSVLRDIFNTTHDRIYSPFLSAAVVGGPTGL
jgi:hypothetical protein